MFPKHTSAFARIGSILLLTLAFIAPAKSSNPNFSNAQRGYCPGGLKCHHGGQCATGDKDHALDYNIISADLPWLEVTSINGEHCTFCHEGYGGVDCSRKYQICNQDDPDAPTCFNGSECYKMGIDNETGKYTYMCDCTTAGLNEDGIVKYAGKYCQHISEEQCGSGNDEMFCTNGGKCTSALDENMKHSHFLCTCPEHRGGTHCEFLKNEGYDDCRLQCAHGTCAKGFKTYDNLIGTGPFPAQLAYDVISTNGEHCVCPDGFTGLTCEIAVQSCGPNKNCYNGSTCIYDENGNPLCDCNSAHTKEVSFAGVSCEQESTSFCEPGPDQDQKDAFCANHGECILDADARHEGCACDDGWSGDLCEIQEESEQVCDLDCENGGSCRFGIKGYKDSYDKLGLPIHAIKSERGMHCSCPSGFTGLKCEVSINYCQSDGSNNDHFCLHGVSCDQDDTNNANGVTKQFSCQCDLEQGEASPQLAGRFCEYAVTEFCSKDSARHDHSFCTNGGKCKNYNDHDEPQHYGCCCPDGYEGEHCQLPAGTLDNNVPITWSPLIECTQAEWITKENDIASSSNPNEHIWINPVYKVPHVDSAEKATILEASVDGSKRSSMTGGIVSGVLSVLFVGGLAGIAYRNRLMKDRRYHFETDWWRGHNTEWWKGEDEIEPDTNIAPATLSRTWSYPIDQSLSGDSLEKPWEYADDLCDLHDVVI